MLDVKQLMGSYVFDLFDVDSISKRFNILERYITTLGFDAVIYTLFPTVTLGNKVLQPIVFNSNDFPKAFLTDYVAEQWEHSDFTVRYIKQHHKEAMDWRDYLISPDLREDEKALIVKAHHDYGVTNAISISLMFNGLGGAGASVISLENSINFLKLKQERLIALTYFLYVFHKLSVDQVEYLPYADLLILSRLTPKELIILRHLISKNPLKNIMNTYPGIKTAKAAYKVLDNVRYKLAKELGIRVTRNYLIYLLGLFDILALYPERL